MSSFDVALQAIRPSLDDFDRLDNLAYSLGHEAWKQDHVIHGMLEKPDGIEVYEIYRQRKTEEDVVVAVVQFGSRLNGYPNIVHGGITALLFDNTFGWLMMSSPRLKGVQAFTANLTVNYRKPVFKNTVAVLRTTIATIDNRKIHMTATMHDADGQLLADCTTLFIQAKPKVPEA